jgi:broad specificity phosphatase PhoE
VIVFVRHGQTVPNRDGLLLGRNDPPLTDDGCAQARRLGAAVEWLGPEKVFTSPLQRAQQTAELVADRMGLEVEIDDRLVEIDYGDWEGRPFAGLEPAVVKQWRGDADFAPPAGESLRAVTERVGSFCAGQLDARVVVAVSHVSPIKGAVTWALGVSPELAWRMRLDVASITRIAEGPTLVTFNETAHLA